MLSYVMLSYAMSCYAMLCYVMLFCDIFRGPCDMPGEPCSSVGEPVEARNLWRRGTAPALKERVKTLKGKPS